MSTRLSASLAFAAAAAFGVTQLRTRLDDRRVQRRMRQLVGVAPMPSESDSSIHIEMPHPLRERRQRKRNAMISSQLAPALELIVGHLKIGRNIGAAIAEVTYSLSEPLQSIFVDAVEEARLGTPLSDSLQRFSDIEGNRHLGVVASAIGLQSKHGGSLVEILEAVHSTIEEEDRLQRDIQTLTADNRISAKVLLALPPATLVVVSLLNPGYASPLVSDSLGQRMSLVGITLAFVGWRWLKRLSTPEVVA